MESRSLWNLDIIQLIGISIQAIFGTGITTFLPFGNNWGNVALSAMCSRMICPRFLTSGVGTSGLRQQLVVFLTKKSETTSTCPKRLPCLRPRPNAHGYSNMGSQPEMESPWGRRFQRQKPSGKVFWRLFLQAVPVPSIKNLYLNISIQYLSYITYHISSNCNSKMCGCFNDTVIMSPLPFVNQQCNLDGIHGFYWIDFLGHSNSMNGTGLSASQSDF